MSEKLKEAFDNCISATGSLKRHVLYWGIAYLQITFMTGLAWITAYLMQTDQYTGDSWAALSSFEKWRIYLFCWGAAIPVLVAFLNKTMARLSPEDYAKDRQIEEEGKTAFALQQMSKLTVSKVESPKP